MNQKFKDFLNLHNAIEYTNLQEGYSFLGDGESWIQFQNEFGSEDILLRISMDKIQLHFDDWSYTFAHTDEGIDECIAEIEALFEDRSYVWKAELNGTLFISLIKDEPGKFYELANRGFKASINGEIVEISPELEQKFVFWDPSMMNPENNPMFLS